MIKLTFLGSGSAFTMKNYHTNMLVSFLKEDGTSRYNLLIDCGSDVRFALAELGYTHNDIDGVYISHLHGDHIGGLEWLGFTRYFDKSKHKESPQLFISEALVDPLWSNSLSGGMSSLQNTKNSLNSYFYVHPLAKNAVFAPSEGYATFQLVQMVHIMDGYSLQPAFGLIVTTPKQKTFITTDTQFAPNQISSFYDSCNQIFHDCETGPYKSGVHAHITDLKTLPQGIREKMWLCHCQDNAFSGDTKFLTQLIGFGGLVQKGQSFEI